MFSFSFEVSDFFSGMDKEQLVFLACVTACALSVGAFIIWGPNPRPKRRGGVVGLQNLGLTCFLNTLLQALASCANFVEWLESCQEQGRVASTLYFLLKVLGTERSQLPPAVEDPFTPSSLIEALRQHGWNISRGEQDAHELFNLLMVTLEEEAHKAIAAESGLTDALEPKSARETSAPTLIDAKTNGTDVINGNHPTADDVEVQSNHCRVTKTTDTSEPDNTSGEGLGKPNLSVGEVTNNESNNITIKKVGKSILAGGETSGDSVNRTRSLPPSLRLINKQGDVITRSVMPKYDVNRNYQASPFCGMLTSQLQCVKCNFKSVLRFDKFDSLSLHLPEPARGRHTLARLLDHFTRTEAVPGVACEGCNRGRDPTLPPLTSTSLKTLSIGKLPKCLCIHIHRLSMASDGTPYKRRDYVDFPEFLVMDSYTHNSTIKGKKKQDNAANQPSDEENSETPTVSTSDSLPCRTASCHNIYRLKAVVVHSGSVESGHFVTYRRGPLHSNTRHRSDRWYFTSDETVKDSSLAEAMKATAYMLYYEKCALTPT